MVKVTCLLFGLVVIGGQFGASTLSLDDPCGGSRPVAGTVGQGGTGANVDAAKAMKDIGISASGAAGLARTLKTGYNSEPSLRVSNMTALFLGTKYLKGFPNKRTEMSDVNAGLQKDYDDVATIVVFMEEILTSETTHFIDTSMYIYDMTELMSSLFGTLCKIKMATEARNQNLVFTITRDVLPGMLRNMDKSTKIMRDFIAFRDAQTYLEELSAGYQ